MARAVVMRATIALMSAVAVWAFAAPAFGAPACTTFNEHNEPAATYDGGGKIIIRGTGFGTRSLVFVRFEQGSRTAELARPVANDLGAFATQAIVLPEDVADGEATIKALDARASATCEISMRTTTDEGSDLGGLYAVWGTVLALFAVALAVLTWRRWKSERLRAAMGKLSFGEPAGPQPPASSEAPEPQVMPSPSPWRETMRTTAEFDDPGPADDPHEDIEWFDPEADEASVKDPAVPPAAVVLEPQPEPDPKPEPEPEPEPAAEPVPEAEPPKLPEGWSEGRLRPQPRHEASDAIERLRREVRTWTRP